MIKLYRTFTRKAYFVSYAQHIGIIGVYCNPFKVRKWRILNIWILLLQLLLIIDKLWLINKTFGGTNSYIWRWVCCMILLFKIETLRKLVETCTSGLCKLKLNGNEESTETYYIRFQLTDSPFCFRTAETGLKLTHQVSAEGKLTKSSWNYTFLSHSCNYTGNFISKFPYKFGSVLVSLKRYFSSSVYVFICDDDQ